MRDADFREVALKQLPASAERDRFPRAHSPGRCARGMLQGIKLDIFDTVGGVLRNIRCRLRFWPTRSRRGNSGTVSGYLSSPAPRARMVRREQFPHRLAFQWDDYSCTLLCARVEGDMDYFQPSAPGQGAFVFDHRRRYRRRWRLRQCIQPSRPSNLLHVSAAIRCFRYYDVEEVQRAAAHFL